MPLAIQDIHYLQKQIWQNFVNYYKNGQYQAALDYLQSEVTDVAALFPADINVFGAVADVMDDLQYVYYMSVDDVLAEDANVFNQYVSNFKYMGLWDAATTYVKGNFVYDDVYEHSIYLYINNNASSNKTVRNEDYWVKIGLLGPQGSPGLGLNLRYNWQSNVGYHENDVVFYGDTLYYATQDNYNSAPREKRSWETLFDISAAKIYAEAKLSVDEPYNGLIWWKYINPYLWSNVDALNYTFNKIDSLNLSWIDADEGGF